MVHTTALYNEPVKKNHEWFVSDGPTGFYLLLECWNHERLEPALESLPRQNPSGFRRGSLTPPLQNRFAIPDTGQVDFLLFVVRDLLLRNP